MQDLFAWTFATWYNAVITFFLFFNLLYWGSSLTARWLLQRWVSSGRVRHIESRGVYPGQLSREVWQSQRSIIVFSLQSIIIQQGIARGWLHISYAITWMVVPQMVVLFFWNELHFYLVHRMLHTKPFRFVHRVHHQSVEPTVFSTFSFHWIEAFLLGTVIIVPLLLHPFQVPALLFLPIMSIALNTIGHCNHDLFPESSAHSLLKFSNRHSLHHSDGRGNFGFMLPWFDRWLGTRIKTPIMKHKPSHE